MKKKLASLPTQVSLSVILNPLGHLPRQRNEPAVFTQSSPRGHDPVPSAHSSTSGKKKVKANVFTNSRQLRERNVSYESHKFCFQQYGRRCSVRKQSSPE